MGAGFPIGEVIRHIYIHVPFCTTRCGYCSFYAEPYRRSGKEMYLSALVREIELFQELYPLQPFTFYWGGGTPSLLQPSEIAMIMDRFDLSQCTEITLEMNPQTVTDRYLLKLKSLPVNRISLGVQSMREEELQFLERKHQARQIREKMALLRAHGYDDISLDLIYGLPGQTVGEVDDSLHEMLALHPEHLSTYCLSIEDDSPFASHNLQLPEDEVVAEMYERIRKTMLQSHYVHYEISNFALPGKESKHNQCYWDGSRYLGLGPGASGFIGNERYTNPEDLTLYREQTEQGIWAPNRIPESREEEAATYVMLNLRTAHGVSFDEYEKRFGMNFRSLYASQLQKWEHSGAVFVDHNHLIIHPNSWFISNEILKDFI